MYYYIVLVKIGIIILIYYGKIEKLSDLSKELQADSGRAGVLTQFFLVSKIQWLLLLQILNLGELTEEKQFMQ